MEERVLKHVPAEIPLLNRGPVFLSGAVSLLLGLLVTGGWHAENYALVQLHPTFVPMQYNTALGFLTAGLSVLLFLSSRTWLAAGTGALAALIGILTGAEYVFGINLGIDELFMDHQVTVQTSNPGRMAPNTALCFAITGTALALQPMLGGMAARANVFRLAGLALISLSAVAMLGYLSGVEAAYGWANLTRMALHTAAGFLVLGTGFIMASRIFAARQSEILSPFWWSGGAFAVGVLASVALAQNIRDNDRRWLEKITAEAADLVATKIDVQMHDTIEAVRRMAHRWRVDNASSVDEWRHDADEYVSDFGAMDQLHWLDSDTLALLSSTTEKADPGLVDQIRRQIRLKDWNTTFDPDVDQTTLFVEPRDGALAKLAIVVPTYADGVLDGHLAAVLSVEVLLEAGWTNAVLQDFHYSVDAEGQRVHETDAPPEGARMAHSTRFSIIGTALEAQATPRAALVGQLVFDTRLILAIGFLFALVGALAVHLAITNGRTRARLAEVNAELQHQSVDLQQSNTDLERSNQQLDEFAYIASHDLKEPLRAISNHSRYLLEDYEDRFEEDGVKRLNRMIFLCQRLDQLIGDLLHFSRLGRQEQARRMTDLNETVRDVESVFDETLAEANAKIIVRDTLPAIVCDAERVAELFRNLIGNAIKYNDNAEKIVEVGVSGGDGRTLYVRDNGIGIEAEHHQDIFRIFKRLHGQSSYGGGTGSGLTFVKKIVEEHGGSIRVESAPGEGTAFYFTLEGERA